ncbi:NTF2 fold immunity protein [Bacteroides sedimenti]|uniref:NTF2 fold domain-containing protein n=1 Tax=Bacteroides sedimenti TaxID=2136147 RepID=A0ABN6Z4R0_9BACE
MKYMHVLLFVVLMSSSRKDPSKETSDVEGNISISKDWIKVDSAYAEFRSKNKDDFNLFEKYDVVTNEEDAAKIGEIILLSIYGQRIYQSRPYSVELRDGIWIIEGSLNADKGGTPYIEIRKRDCKIMKISHCK